MLGKLLDVYERVTGEQLAKIVPCFWMAYPIREFGTQMTKGQKVNFCVEKLVVSFYVRWPGGENAKCL